MKTDKVEELIDEAQEQKKGTEDVAINYKSQGKIEAYNKIIEELDNDNESENGKSNHSDYRFIENIILMGDAIQNALYKSLRYQVLGYDHLKGDALGDIETARGIANEVLERHTPEEDKDGE